MAFPPSKNRENKEDPNIDAVAREQLALKEAVAAASAATPAAPNSYAKYTDEVVAGANADTVKDRGAKHSRT